MINVIFKTKPDKINAKFRINLKAGILYKDSKPVDKILFHEEFGSAVEVWNDKFYSFDVDSDEYINDVVNLDNLIYECFQTEFIDLMQLYTIYKMFLNDSNYLFEHAFDFGMIKSEVGYKEKIDLMPDKTFNDKNKQLQCMSLLKIINYKELNYEFQKKTTTK